MGQERKFLGTGWTQHVDNICYSFRISLSIQIKHAPASYVEHAICVVSRPRSDLKHRQGVPAPLWMIGGVAGARRHGHANSFLEIFAVSGYSWE